MRRNVSKVLLIACLTIVPALAQLTPDQRVRDFESLADLVAKYYGVANWKIQALGVNPLDSAPYLARVREAKNDLEYFEICMQYIASFKDGHTVYRMLSTYYAELGVWADKIDGKALIVSIDRTRYPVSSYPFQIGDELVSIDGVPVQQIAVRLAALSSAGGNRAEERLSMLAVTSRAQEVDPRVVDLPDESDVVIRRFEGEEASYRLKWSKTGDPVRSTPPMLSPTSSKSTAKASRLPDISTLEHSFTHPWVRTAGRPRPEGFLSADNPQFTLGAAFPYYGLPAGFVVRRGLRPTDTLFSGTYTAEGSRIGLIRIPTFAPSNPSTMLIEFMNEIAFMNQNTDGLIVDVSHNGGGSPSLGLDLISLLMPQSFTFARASMLGHNLDFLVFRLLADVAEELDADTWVPETYRFLAGALKTAQGGPRAMTGPLAIITPLSKSQFTVAPVELNPTWTSPPGLPPVAAYSKPLVVLVDDLSFSMADFFAAVIQDNRRAKLVGVRTSGLGGGRADYLAGSYGEGIVSLTYYLGIRERLAEAPGLPSAPVIENLGVTPEIQLDFATRENLIQNGRPFRDGLTRAILDEIRGGR